MYDIISQAAIFILGAGAIFLVAKKNKWGFVLGLLSQPFWYITSYTNEQWGIFTVSIIYTFSWGLGVYEWFYKDKKNLSTFAVKGIILNENNEILLLQRNPKTRDKDNWDLPGGLVEKGEQEKISLAREIIEELKLNIEITKKSGKWSFYRSLDKKTIHVQNYFCKILNGSIELSDEHIGYKWVTIEKIRDYPVKDKSLYDSIEKTIKK